MNFKSWLYFVLKRLPVDKELRVKATLKLDSVIRNTICLKICRIIY